MLRILALVLVLTGCQQDQPAPAPRVQPRPLGMFAIDEPVLLGGTVLTPADVRLRVAGVNPPSQHGVVACAYHVMGSDGDRAYLWVLCDELGPADQILSGSSVPLVLDAAGIHLPGDGSQYARDIKKMFPETLIPTLQPDNDNILALETAALATRHTAHQAPDR